MKIKDLEFLANKSLEKFDRYELAFGEHGALCFAFAWAAMKRYLGYEEKVDTAYCEVFALALRSLIEDEQLEPQVLFDRYCLWLLGMVNELTEENDGTSRRKDQ